MHHAEARALKRAVIVLLLVSSVRFVWARTDTRAPTEGSVLEDLLEESRGAADEGRRRAEPLAAGERVDPNRAGEDQLDRLPGVGPATARAIVETRAAGSVFRSPEDLAQVPGIGPATVARIRGLLDLDAPPPVRVRASMPARARPGDDGAPPVDLNRATPEELIELPGIGPALAGRIVEERRKQMFSTIEDLTRVPGIGPATVERLRGVARVDGGR